MAKLGTVLFAAAVAAGALAWQEVAHARRRNLLRTGEIRELHTHRAAVGGCTVHARVGRPEAEDGAAPVVLVHGLGVSGSYFVPLAERLATHFAVHAPDLPGHGRSDTPPQALDVPRLAQALVAWMDAVGLGRVSLVGHSLGCQVAVEAAVRWPQRFDRLVLIGPSGDPRARGVVRQAGRLLLGAFHERPSLVALVVADYLRMGLRFFAELSALFRHRVEDRLPLLTLPVAVIRGENDPLAPRRWVEEVARLAHARRVVVVPRWGHAVQHGAPDQVAEAVATFLREGAAPAGPPGEARRHGDRLILSGGAAPGSHRP